MLLAIDCPTLALSSVHDTARGLLLLLGVVIIGVGGLGGRNDFLVDVLGVVS